MPSEPIYLAQTAELMSNETARDWVRKHADAAREQGANLLRVTTHADIPNLILFEAWEDRRAEQGEPRWQLAAA